ncbi:vWA domain-containing protein [Humidisolicoccus flavus]|uniref:vWA domain-containing protein n=1 Tax=Humidisolicoccus flavus TaxID=3111414 RepID=UPI0032539C56
MDVSLFLQWWMIPVLVILGAGIVVLVLRSRSKSAKAVPVAHTERLTRLPEFKRAISMFRGLAIGVTALAVVAAFGAGYIAARPAAVNSNQNDDYKRDILLCLDISGSMVDIDAQILDKFKDIARGLDGERIGMRVWDSSSVMVFPLTSDYDYIIEQLDLYQRAFTRDLSEEEYFSYNAGANLGNGASLVGDGLASCALDFQEENENNRPRSIILATDNFVNGQQIFSLEQAGQLAVDRGVRVYGINPYDFGAFDPPSAQMREVVEKTGGLYYPLDFGDSVNSIVESIQATEAGYIETPPQAQIVDRPGGWLVMLFVLVGGMVVLAWRLRL